MTAHNPLFYNIFIKSSRARDIAPSNCTIYTHLLRLVMFSLRFPLRDEFSIIPYARATSSAREIPSRYPLASGERDTWLMIL